MPLRPDADAPCSNEREAMSGSGYGRKRLRSEARSLKETFSCLKVASLRFLAKAVVTRV